MLMSEVSPWLLALNLIAAGISFRLYRPAAPYFLLFAAVCAWPLAQVPGVVRSVESQLPSGGGPAPFRFLDCFRAIAAEPIEPEALPGNILLYRGRGSGPRPILIDIYGGAWQR